MYLGIIALGVCEVFYICTVVQQPALVTTLFVIPLLNCDLKPCNEKLS